MKQLLGFVFLFSACAWAQAPRAYFPWWESPLTRTLNLTKEQGEQIHSTSREYRDRMIDQRAAVEKAEAEIQDLFNQQEVDEAQASEAIDRLVAARGDLTRSLTEMSLKLRRVLTPEQWRDLQRGRSRWEPFREMGRQRGDPRNRQPRIPHRAPGPQGPSSPSGPHPRPPSPQP